MAAPKDDPKDLSFEGHLDALEKVVSDLEGDDLSLEASIDRYRVGVDHLSACRRFAARFRPAMAKAGTSW